MTESKPTADDIMRRLVMKRTPAERLRMCARMFWTARALALAGIAQDAETTDEADRRRGIFLRFYGNEFTGAQRETIVEVIVKRQQAS